MMKQFILILATLFIAQCNQTSQQAIETNRKPDKPNFILILTDDTGWPGTSVQMDKNVPDSKHDYYHTPNIERLAARGRRFSNGYAPAPVCSPTRYSIQYSQTPARLNKWNVFQKTDHIDHESMLALPQVLHKADSNYVVAHFGKWHIGCMPSQLGYDESDGMTTNREGHYNGNKEHIEYGTSTDPKLIRSLTHRSNDFMERMMEQGKPFYLQVSHYANHTKVECKPETYTKYKASPHPLIIPEFAGMTENLDEGIGMLLDKVKELGIEDNTYIFLTADNGGVESFPPKRLEEGYNYPLEGGKWIVYEGGVRVPFIVAGPGVEENSQCDEPVTSMDLLPTIASLVDYDLNALPDYIEGNDISPLILGTKEKIDREPGDFVFHYPRYVEWHMIDVKSAIRIGNYKLVKDWEKNTFELRERIPRSSAARVSEHNKNKQLIDDSSQLSCEESQLYDLKNDIGENNDLSGSMPDRVEQMDQMLVDYLVSVGQPVPPLIGL